MRRGIAAAVAIISLTVAGAVTQQAQTPATVMPASVLAEPLPPKNIQPRPQVVEKAVEKPRPVKKRASRQRVSRQRVTSSVTNMTGIALKIASCESGDGRGSVNWRAENPRSSASGGFQFIDSTWRSVTGLRPPASAYSPRVQIAAFYKLWAGGNGAFHWNASRHCWG